MKTLYALAALGASLVPSLAMACDSLEKVRAGLNLKLGQYEVFLGSSTGQTGVILWVSPTDDSWTITETSKGCTRVAVTGQGLIYLPPGENV